MTNIYWQEVLKTDAINTRRRLAVIKMKPSDLKNMKSKTLPDNSESSSRLVESSQGNVGSELQQRCKKVATTKEKQF